MSAECVQTFSLIPTQNPPIPILKYFLLFLSIFCYSHIAQIQKLSECLKFGWIFLISIFLIISPHLDNEDVILTSLLEMSENLTSSVVQVGHDYAMTSASSSLSLSAKMHEKYHGLTQLSFIKRLSEARDIKNLIENFKSIASYILDRERMK